ncbi:Tn7 transposase TnsA N-terminal domain-containing protein [Variovorax gossypii]
MSTPARRLIKPTTPRTVHLLNLRTLPAPVQAEATTESNFVHIAALCPATKSVASQPETIELPGGKRYTPDYCVETQDGGQSFWEVKLESRIGSYRHRFALAAAHFSQRGAPFFVISEKQLRDGRLHRDARLIGVSSFSVQ